MMGWSNHWESPSPSLVGKMQPEVMFEPSFGELVERLQQDDRAAVGALIERYGSALRRAIERALLVRRLDWAGQAAGHVQGGADASDVFETVLLPLLARLRKLPDGNPDPAQFETPGHLVAYLKAIAMHGLARPRSCVAASHRSGLGPRGSARGEPASREPSPSGSLLARELMQHDGSLDEQYSALWTQHSDESGTPPSAADFLACHRDASAAQRLDIVLTDQLLRWRRGCPKPIADYLAEHPALAGDPEAVLRLIEGEFLARLERDEAPEPVSYMQVFPDLAADIRLQCEVDCWLTLPQAPGQSMAATVDYQTGGSASDDEGAGVSEGKTTRASSDGSMVAEPSSRHDAPLSQADFQLVRQIGSGGMGEVYEAIQKSLGKRVALKLIHREALDSPSRVGRFFVEARALARLRHAHIVGVHGIGRMDDGRYFLVMDLVEGGTTLASLVKGGVVPFRRAAELVAAVALAIDHAHSRSVIHRDLKPSNVLLDADGNPHVSDFGLAKVFDTADPEHALTTADQVLGSPHYMAPEQADPARGPITPRTDVYALGGLIYALLTGKPPVKGDSLTVLLTQVVSPEPVPSPRVLRGEIPPDLEQICRTCLEKDAGKRYASARAVAEALRSWLCSPPPVEGHGTFAPEQPLTQSSEPATVQTNLAQKRREAGAARGDWAADRSLKERAAIPRSDRWYARPASALRSRRVMAATSAATLILLGVLVGPALLSRFQLNRRAPMAAVRARLSPVPAPIDLQKEPGNIRALVPHWTQRPASIAVRSSDAIIKRFGQGTGSIAVVLDCSGSMIKPEPKKFEYAKQAIARVLSQVPKGTTVSIWTFSQLPEGVDPRNLSKDDMIMREPERTISRLREPSTWEPNQVDDLVKQLNRLRPFLETPLIEAMWKAAQDLRETKGFKTLLVITDGIDDRFTKSKTFNPSAVDIPTFIDTKFRPLSIRVNMVYLSAFGDADELTRARGTFAEPLARLDPPGAFETAEHLDELIAGLKKSIKQRLTCQVLRPDGTPLGGEPLDVTDVEAEADLWWPKGLAPGTYRLRVHADRTYEQEITLAPGDRVVLQLVERHDGGIAFARVLDDRGGQSESP